MKHIILELPGSFEICMFGDLHGFVTGFPDKTVQRAIDHIKSGKNRYFATGGDMIDVMSVQDNRYVHGQNKGQFERGQDQADGVINLLNPISDKLLWGIMGNHEARQRNMMDWTNYILSGLGCGIYENDRESAYLLKAHVNHFKFLDWHGSGYISSNANDDYIMKENERRSVKKKLRRLPGDDCEVLVMHHIHKMRIIPPTDSETMKMISMGEKLKSYYPPPAKKYIDKENYYYDINDRWYASSGAFLPTYTEGFSGYGEVKGYRPSEMGYVKIVVKNDKLVKVMEQIF
jgi:hypothetical protein